MAGAACFDEFAAASTTSLRARSLSKVRRSAPRYTDALISSRIVVECDSHTALVENPTGADHYRRSDHGALCPSAFPPTRTRTLTLMRTASAALVAMASTEWGSGFTLLV